MWHAIVNGIRYPKSSLFLCGSTASGSATDGSDIDLICTSPYTSYVYSEEFKHTGKQLQVTFFPKQKILDYLICDLCSIDRIYISMWSNCRSIIDDSDAEKVLPSIQKYISTLQTHYHHSSDDYLFFLTHKIVKLCEELERQKGKNPALIAAELLLDISRFIVGKQYDIKHVARSVADNPTAEKFLNMYLNAVSTQQYDSFCSQIQGFIKNYSTWDSSSTTGLSYNQPPEGLLVAYFPCVQKSKNTLTALTGLELVLKLSGFTYYSFAIETNQAMDSGLYLCIDTDASMIQEAYSNIFGYHKKNANAFRLKDIKLLYPYRTAFSTGLYFGGRTIQHRLTPFFCRLSSLLSPLRRPGYNQMMYSAAICIYNTIIKHIPQGVDILTAARDSLVADVADPIGMYNINQMVMLCSTLKDMDTDRRISIQTTPQEELLHETMRDILTSVISLSEEDILLPTLSYKGNRRETLLHHIILHVQDIMMLSFQERHKTLCVCLSNNT